MKVEINGHICTIGWQYESKIINKLFSKSGIYGTLKGYTKKEICDILKLKAYPLPDSTHCIITDTVTGDVYTGTVKRFHKDPWSREMARKNALTKALWTLFPEGKDKGHNEEQSKQRKRFWNVYYSRKVNNPMTTIEKAIKKGLFTKEDISTYNTLHCNGYSENVY